MENTNQKPKMTPKFFFLSLGTIVSLIVSVTAFLNLSFETFNFKFPDVLNATYEYGYNSYNYDGARMALATLIIFFPIFLLIIKYWKRAIREGLGHIDAGIRKWMIYLLLFMSAITVAVDLVTLVRYFVAGEITTRFILKVLVTLLVAVLVGLHFIWELKGKEKILGCKVNLWMMIKSSVLVLALIIWSFTVIGTPGQQRIWRLDDRRVQDLNTIQWQIINYWQQKEKLPENLAQLKDPISGFSLPVDPEFEKGKTYEYAVKDLKALKFELCATFSAEIPKGWQENKYGIMPYGMGGGIMESRDMAVSYPYPGPGGVGDSWDHKEGRTCFERTIDKDLYPPYPKPEKIY